MTKFQFVLTRRQGAAIDNPVDLPNLNRWYDPSDNATLTMVSGEVDQMADKSGNGYTIAAPNSGRRANLTTINGVQALTFSSDYLSDNSTVPNRFGAINANDAPFTYFEIVQPANVSHTGHHMNIRGSNANNRMRLFQESGPVVGFRKTDASSTTKDATSASIDTTPQLFTLVVTGTLATLRRNGVVLFANADVDVGTSAANRYTMAADYDPPSNSNFFIGKVGEVALYERALSAPEIAAMEAYLAAKWGITI